MWKTFQEKLYEKYTCVHVNVYVFYISIHVLKIGGMSITFYCRYFEVLMLERLRSSYLSLCIITCSGAESDRKHEAIQKGIFAPVYSTSSESSTRDRS